MSRRLKGWLAGAGAFATLVGSLYAGWATLDARYAKADQVQQQFQSVGETLKKGQLQQLRRERFELQREKARRPLTGLEQGRLKEVEDAIGDLERELGLKH